MHPVNSIAYAKKYKIKDVVQIFSIAADYKKSRVSVAGVGGGLSFNNAFFITNISGVP